MCEEVPRQNAAENRKIPESGSVIPREGVESPVVFEKTVLRFTNLVIPREGVESPEVVVEEPREPHFVIPREGVESSTPVFGAPYLDILVIPREGVER